MLSCIHKLIEVIVMNKYYFTFGTNHFTEGGTNLSNFYVVIEAESYYEAREKMFDVRGDKWAFQYESAEEAGVERFYLMEMKLSQVQLL